MRNLKKAWQHLLTQKAKGQATEQAAAVFLKKHNITIIASNFYSKFGEIDLIGTENNTLIFFEVRYRCQSHYGSALETVTSAKQKRIIKTATLFILQHPKLQRYCYRFDIIGASPYNGEIEFIWQKNAFQAEDVWI